MEESDGQGGWRGRDGQGRSEGGGEAGSGRLMGMRRLNGMGWDVEERLDLWKMKLWPVSLRG